MGKKYEFISERKESITTFLSVAVPNLSRAKSDLLVKSGEVRVNGVKVKKNCSLEAGDTVSVFVPDSLVEKKNILTVYEDSNIVVFDKPKHTPFDTVPSIVGSELIPVHRLDTNTTGVIVFARTQSAADALTAAFKERKTEKKYEAIVSPAPKSDSAVLSAHLTVNDRTATVSATDKPGSKQIVTEYSVVERIGDAAVISVFPHTGRTHQIRAHLAFIGCPIVGDDKYGGKKTDGVDSQLLRAVSIVFNGLSGGVEYLNGQVFSVESHYDGRFLRNLHL